MPAKTDVPAAVASRPDRKKAEGLPTSARPRPVISKTPISSVGPKRFFMARRMRKWWPASPSKDMTASTMCSTTRRPGDLPVLGDVADEDHAGVVVLGVADQGLGGAAHLR